MARHLRITAMLVIVSSFSSLAAAGWETQFKPEDRACIVVPPGHRIALAMKEDPLTGERVSRIYMPARLEAGGIAYLRVDNGPKHVSQKIFIEGTEAQAILNEMWTGRFVEVGSSVGSQPIEVDSRIRLEGIKSSVEECMVRLGWRQENQGDLAVDPAPTPSESLSGNEHDQSDGETDEGSCEIAGKLRDLKQLLDEGILTSNEFDDLKERLLQRCRDALRADAQ